MKGALYRGALRVLRGILLATRDVRIAILRAAVAAGAALVLITECLGFLRLLVPHAVAIGWLLALAFIVLFARPGMPRVSAVECLFLAPFAAIFALLGWVAWMAPPNTYDSMAYHMPRVVYWAQQGSVDNFPASYLMQLQMPPFAEYAILHGRLLTGSDRLANFAQWGGYVGSVLAVSVLARELGASRLAQWYAALAAATIPNAILQASGAKNDCVLSFWMLCACVFGLVAVRTGSRYWLAGASIALALLTKGTAYLFLPPLLAGVLWPVDFRRLRTLAGVSIGAVLLLNGCFYWRNFELSGSPLGFDSANGDGLHRVRNDRLGAGVTASNAVRGLAGHIAFRSREANERLHGAILNWHATLGLDPNDPATTWRDASFTPTVNSNHESNSPNRVHLALLAVAVAYSLWRHPLRWFALGWLCAWFLFFSLLRWQPYMTHLHLPLFFAGAVFIGVWLERLRPRCLAFAVCLLLLTGARPYLFDNWLRPAASLRQLSRQTLQFKDVEPLLRQSSVEAAVRRVRDSGCRRVGIDSSRLELSYPVIALLRQSDPSVQFRQIAPNKATQRYAAPGAWPPCAIVCIQCDANEPGRVQVSFPE